MTITYPVLALAGAFFTFYLAKHNRFDAIRASAALSIIAYLIFAQLSLNAELYSIVFFWRHLYWHERPSPLWCLYACQFSNYIFIVFCLFGSHS